MSAIDDVTRRGSLGKARCHHASLTATRMPLRYKVFWIVLAMTIAATYGGLIYMIIRETTR